jgi:hypothetical protein
MFGLTRNKVNMVDRSQALAGRSTPMPLPGRHAVLGT